MLSLGCFLHRHQLLVHWSICLSSFLDYFKNGIENLTRRTDQVFISLMGFILQSLISRSFVICLRYTFLLLFSFIFICLMFSTSTNPKYLCTITDLKQKVLILRPQIWCGTFTPLMYYCNLAVGKKVMNTLKLSWFTNIKMYSQPSFLCSDRGEWNWLWKMSWLR